jgi:S-adenosylmethionine hydrolase
VLHIDRFGNLVTSVPAALLSDENMLVEVRGKRIAGLSRAYADGEGLLALIGSHGYLEVAVRNGSAAQALGAQIGDSVVVRRA